MSVVRVSSLPPTTLVGLCWDSIPRYASQLSRFYPDWPSFSLFFAPFCIVKELKKECLITFILAILLTWARYRVDRISKRCLSKWKVLPKYFNKLPESIWKLLYYGISWLFSLYLHVSVYNTFNNPLSIWDGWREDASLPLGVVLVYSSQSSFYLHSVYATVAMDQWRSDSVIMFLHHFVALALLMLSYAHNFTLAGLLVLFMQDSSDALLEITKVCVYLKRRTDGRYYPWLEKAGNLVLYSFAVVWLICRIYWFCSKVLYATLYGGTVLGPPHSLAFPPLGIMLVAILLLNLFWFNFIIRMVIRVWRTGVEPEDNREYDTDCREKRE